MKAIFFFLFASSILISCNDEVQPDQIETSTLELDTTEIEWEEEQEPDIPFGMMEIVINEMSFLFEEIDMSCYYEVEGTENFCKFEDTAFFNLWPGDWMEDKVVKLKDDDSEIIEMYVQSVSVIGVDSDRMIEVPFCALSGWKNSTSSWKQIQPKNNEFHFESFDQESEPLIVELDELKNELMNSCGEGWYEEYADADSLSQIPYWDFTDRYNYKIITRDLSSGEITEHIFVFFTPTSC
jgi:hypothetical protein